MIVGTLLSFVVLLAVMNPELWGFACFMWGAYAFHKLTEGEPE